MDGHHAPHKKKYIKGTAHKQTNNKPSVSDYKRVPRTTQS